MQIKELVLDAWKTFGTGDPDRIGALFTAEAEWLAPAGNAAARILGGHHLVGRERIVRFLTAEVPAVFGADLTGDVETVLAEGDTVVLEIRLRSLLPNGRRYDNAYCFLFTLRDGRIHRIREHLDTHRGLLAFGLVDEPG
jgi:ketosteroid isomerase-like protein